MNFRLTYFRQSLFPALLLLVSSSAMATVTTISYGDDDGFGVGATTFKNVSIDSTGPGEAPFTDRRLISSSCCSWPAFTPTSTLTFAPFSTIGSVVVTLRMAGFGSNASPLAPNSIVVNGVAIPADLLNSFGPQPDTFGPNVETHSIALAPSFFALFTAGSVDLTGTAIHEGSGAGSFQVDFLRFDIEGTQAGGEVPEPSTIGLMLAAGAGLAWRMRRRV